MEALLAFGAALLTFRLAGLLAARYRSTRRPELFAWSAGLAAYAVAAAAIAWGEAAAWDESRQTETDTICPYCGVGCNLTLHVQDNQIVKVTSPMDHDVTILPGHGPASTIGAERRGNGFLQR